MNVKNTRSERFSFHIIIMAENEKIGNVSSSFKDFLEKIQLICVYFAVQMFY